MRTTDNNIAKPLLIEDSHLQNLQIIADINIAEITIENSDNLLIFPSCLKKSRDKIGNEKVFKLKGRYLHTGNIMGFVGVNNSELIIQSRFAQDDKQDYFLHYMLQKVFCINLFDMKHSSSNIYNIFDFLLYLFPHFLNKALRQGLFKEYINKEYNNSRLRGALDTNRHLRLNIPFAGKIAYRTREYSYDNRITQLVRHTIEYIRQHQFAGNILKSDDSTAQAVSQIIYSTPTYNYRDRKHVINNNLRPLSHSFYNDYRELQQICLKILRSDGLKYGEGKDKVYGILFDGAWLWEEYLYTLLKKHNFNHPENKNNKGAIYLFKEDKYPRYPDFWKKNIVLDAKYKKPYNKKNESDRDDIHQVISYIHVMKARIGGLIYPDKSETTDIKEIGELNGYGGNIYKCIIKIPQNIKEYPNFIHKITNEETILVNKIIDKYNKVETS